MRLHARLLLALLLLVLPLLLVLLLLLPLLHVQRHAEVSCESRELQASKKHLQETHGFCCRLQGENLGAAGAAGAVAGAAAPAATPDAAAVAAASTTSRSPMCARFFATHSVAAAMSQQHEVCSSCCRCCPFCCCLPSAATEFDGEPLDHKTQNGPIFGAKSMELVPRFPWGCMRCRAAAAAPDLRHGAGVHACPQVLFQDF